MRYWPGVLVVQIALPLPMYLAKEQACGRKFASSTLSGDDCISVSVTYVAPPVTCKWVPNTTAKVASAEVKGVPQGAGVVAILITPEAGITMVIEVFVN